MLPTPTDFPQAGSRAFLIGSADPVTIIRRNADATALVRIDARPHHPRNRDASGNRTVDADQLVATEKEAFEAPVRNRRRKAGQ